MKTKEQVQNWLDDKYADGATEAYIMSGWLKCKYGEDVKFKINVLKGDYKIIESIFSEAIKLKKVTHLELKNFVEEDDIFKAHSCISLGDIADTVNDLSRRMKQAEAKLGINKK